MGDGIPIIIIIIIIIPFYTLTCVIRRRRKRSQGDASQTTITHATNPEYATSAAVAAPYRPPPTAPTGSNEYSGGYNSGEPYAEIAGDDAAVDRRYIGVLPDGTTPPAHAGSVKPRYESLDGGSHHLASGQGSNPYEELQPDTKL